MRQLGKKKIEGKLLSSFEGEDVPWRGEEKGLLPKILLERRVGKKNTGAPIGGRG